MWLVDVNVLLYAVDGTSPHHEVSRDWLERSLGGVVPVGLAWSSLITFLRLSTNRGVFVNPLTVEEACHQVRSWLAAPAAIVVEPTSRHVDVLCGMLRESGTAGNLVSDAHLATLALEHSAAVVTFDRDFGRFAGVRWEQPSA